MAMTRSQEAARRLKQITKAHEKAHYEFNRDFTLKLNSLLKKYEVTDPNFHNWPLDLHEELAGHKEELVRNLALADEAKQASVASLPRPKIMRAGQFRMMQ